MQPHQQRVVDEKNELENKCTALDNFIGGTIFNSLSEGERSLLSKQLGWMKGYLSVLVQRIDGFK